MRKLFLFAAIAVVVGMFVVGCGGDEQTGWGINSDTQSYFDEAVSLKNDIISFIGKAKLLRTESFCDTSWYLTDTTLTHYDIAFFKSKNGEIGITQYDKGGFGLSTISKGKFIEANIDSDSFWFRNTHSKPGDFPIETTWLDEGKISHRIYVVAGQGTQLDLHTTFDKLEANTKMWKELLN